MHARLGPLYPRPGKFDHVLVQLREALVSAIQKEPGSNGMLILNDRQANKIVGISMWESEAAILASTQSEYFQEQVSRVITHVAGPPKFENYELEII